jgi:multiple sugar transport system ATP-binding protein
VAEFIGSPAMNMVAGATGGSGLVAQGVELPLSDAQCLALVDAGAGGVIYGLRPASLSFGASGLPGTLSMIEPTGPETYVTTDTALGKLTARLPGHAPGRVGDPVHLVWRAEHAHLFDATSEKRLA